MHGLQCEEENKFCFFPNLPVSGTYKSQIDLVMICHEHLPIGNLHAGDRWHAGSRVDCDHTAGITCELFVFQTGRPELIIYDFRKTTDLFIELVTAIFYTKVFVIIYSKFSW